MTILRQRGETITLAATRGFATVRGIPPGFNTLELEAPSSTIEAITVAFGPKLKRLYYYDASTERWSEYTAEATDRNTGSTIPMGAQQTADRLYVGCTAKPEGFSIDVGTVNGAGTANSVWEYPNVDTWTNLSATDGTDSTMTFDQDGLVTWTMPTTPWQAKTLREVAGETAQAPVTEKLFWVRQRPDVALTTDPITLLQITALLNRTLNTLTPETEGQDVIRVMSTNGGKPAYRFRLDRHRHGSVELVSASITSAAHLNWFLER